MKTKCPVEKIKSKITLAERVTGKNLSLPVLGNVILEAKGSSLYVRATNLEVGVEFTVPVKVEKEGVCAISGSVLNNFLSALSSGEMVTIEQIGNNISISSEKNTTLLKTQPHNDFPVIPKTKEKPITIPIKNIVDGIKSVWFSSATSDIKPEIASVYVYTENNNLVFVATDSFRLAEKKIQLKDIHIESVLIPYKNAIEVIRFFEDSTGDVKVSFNKNQLSLETENVYFTTRLTDGVYPDYRQIIPKEFKTQAVVLKKEFSEALKLANIFADEFHRIILRVIAEDNFMEVESKNTNVGENVTKIDTHIEGEGIEVSFNHKYITDVFQVLNQDSISLKFSDVNKPLVVTGVGDESLTYLIMPVNR